LLQEKEQSSLLQQFIQRCTLFRQASLFARQDHCSPGSPLSHSIFDFITIYRTIASLNYPSSHPTPNQQTHNNNNNTTQQPSTTFKMCSHTNSSISSSNTTTLYASGLTCDYCHGPVQYNPMARRWYCLRCRRFM